MTDRQLKDPEKFVWWDDSEVNLLANQWKMLAGFLANFRNLILDNLFFNKMVLPFTPDS